MPVRRQYPITVHDGSSESEQEERKATLTRRYHWGAYASSKLGDDSAPKAKEENKKGKRLPPQEAVDKIWNKFSEKRFSKAMTLMPLARAEPSPPPPPLSRSNELLSAGYDRAVKECRRKVRRIVQQCRRVNMRYRDSEWEIEWDLKTGSGRCLNSLMGTHFNVQPENRANPESSVPKAVRRVHEIFEKPTFLKSVNGSDVKQGTLGDCWFISCVSGLASIPGGIEKICVEYDTKIGVYGFVFYRDGEWIYSIVDDKLYLTSPNWDSRSYQRDLLQQIDREDVERVYRKTYQTGSKALFFAQNRDQNETWLPLLEKAYAKAHGDYDSLAGGWMGEGLEDLTGGVTTELLLSDILDTNAFWDNELSHVNVEFSFGCTTGLLESGYGSRDGIAERHAYNIMDARTLQSGTRLLKLRNPWGRVKAGTWEGAWSDGSKEWTAEAQEELGHKFGSDSSFWISYDDFLAKYQHIDRTRLFRDPDWRCCQRWIGVDVPWRSEFREQFRLELSRPSPVVLVLSQLDKRYFKGLEGQYEFRLNFRLYRLARASQGTVDKDRTVHSTDGPGDEGKESEEDEDADEEEDERLIVQSHYYLMGRSVGVELPSLDPGRYSILVAIEAERSLEDNDPVEEVMRHQLKNRTDNNKLAQVGRAYDLAHSKAASHLDELARLRQRADRARESEERKASRRDTWAYSHLVKDIERRQGKRNEEKRKRREAARKAAASAATAATTKTTGSEAVNEPKTVIAKEDKQTSTDEHDNESVEKAVALLVDKAVQTETPAAEVVLPSPCDAVSLLSLTSSNSTPVTTPKSEHALEVVPLDGSRKMVAVPPLEPIEASEKPTEEPKKGEEAQAELSAPRTREEKSPGQREDSKRRPREKSQRHRKTSDSHDADYHGSDSGEAVYDDSSDSPVEDWEELYTSEFLSLKSKDAAAKDDDGTADDDSEDEETPGPWNAICIVGLRAYSKDEALTLRVVMENGELEGSTETTAVVTATASEPVSQKTQTGSKEQDASPAALGKETVSPEITPAKAKDS